MSYTNTKLFIILLFQGSKELNLNPTPAIKDEPREVNQFLNIPSGENHDNKQDDIKAFKHPQGLMYPAVLRKLGF